MYLFYFIFHLVTRPLPPSRLPAFVGFVFVQGVSEAWEVWEMPLLVHPCYLLRRKGRVDGGGGGSGWSGVGDSGEGGASLN